MSGTYSKIYIHIIFAVKNRNALIHSEWEERLYKYITGIIRQKKHKLIAINGTSNHIHIFIGMKPDCALSDLVREIKKSSNSFINDNKLCPCKFAWQEGYGAFSYSYSQIDTVAKYVLNQKKHHKTSSFREEYVKYLKKYEIEYDEKYLFDWNE